MALIISFTGHTTILVQPYPRIVSEPGLYATVRVHAEAPANESPHQRTDFAVMCLILYFTLHSPRSLFNTKHAG